MEQYVPARLVSSIYSMAPPERGYMGRDERERLTRVAVRKLVATRGTETVVTMIRKHPGADANLKAWLVLTAYAEERKGHRATSA